MKKLFKIILLGLMIYSCKSPVKEIEPIIEDGYAVDYAILYNEQIEMNDSLTGVIKSYKDSIITLNLVIEKLNADNITLKDSLVYYIEDSFVNKYKIERIKEYDKIVRNNSSQSKYFIGWVRRVLED